MRKTYIRKNTKVAALLFLIAVTVILINVIFHNSGYLSPDSTHYLGLAERLLNGFGPFVTDSGRSLAGEVYFAVWPIGYPSMIAVVSYLTGLDVFLASKLLNILLLTASMLIVAESFGSNGPIISLAFLFAAPIMLFSYTWSEAPFIFFLVCFASAVANLLKPIPEARGHRIALAFIFISSIGLFLSRYIGIFFIAPAAGAAALLFIQGRRVLAARLLVVSTLALILALLYLLFNWYMTGYPTGMPRIPAPETHLELMNRLLVAVVKELMIPVVMHRPLKPEYIVLAIAYGCLVLWLATQLCRSNKEAQGNPYWNYQLSYFVTGLTYLLAIITARWTHQFDSFNVRLLHPGVILLTFAAFSYLFNHYRGASKAITIFIVASVLLSIAGYGYSAYKEVMSENYFKATHERLRRYSDIPRGSIVIFGDQRLNYLRPADLHIAYPAARPYQAYDETWERFLRSFG